MLNHYGDLPDLRKTFDLPFTNHFSWFMQSSRAADFQSASFNECPALFLDFNQNEGILCQAGMILQREIEYTTYPGKILYFLQLISDGCRCICPLLEGRFFKSITASQA